MLGARQSWRLSASRLPALLPKPKGLKMRLWTRHTGLFTFAHSAKHVALYQKFGFHARFLTAIMSATAQRAETLAGWSRYSASGDAAKDDALRGSRDDQACTSSTIGADCVPDCHGSGVEVAICHRQFGRNLAQRFVDGYFAHTA
jgi:hypothetical protein